nr:hypothetical protein 1DG000067 [Iridovirus CN01]UPA43821.1 hypothetical protein L2A02_0067 [Iridovirus CN01]
MRDYFFFSCENVAIISMKSLHLYPKIKAWVSGLNVVFDKQYVLFIIVKKGPVTKDTLNDLFPMGLAVISTSDESATIVHTWEAAENYIRRLFDYVLNFFTVPVNLKVKLSKPDSEIYTLTNLGFTQPDVDPDDAGSLILKYNTVINPMQTMSYISNLKATAGTDTCSVVIRFPESLAKNLEGYHKKGKEVGGKICISKYDGNVAVLGFNTETAIYGEDFAVNIPHNQLAPISFHTHPDTSYTDIKYFLAWPSAPDMKLLVTSFLIDLNVLVHYVVSGEGIWYTHIRPEFQKILLHLKRNGLADCARTIIDDVFNIIIDTEDKRTLAKYRPSQRERMILDYLKHVNSIKFSHLTNSQSICGSPQTDFLLFRVGLIKWKYFPKEIEFNYIKDPAGGFTCRLKEDCSIIQNMIKDKKSYSADTGYTEEVAGAQDNPWYMEQDYTELTKHYLDKNIHMEVDDEDL